MMMMVMRTMRIKTMMAVLRFALMLLPRSGFAFRLQPCLFKYIQLSSVDQPVLPGFSAPTSEP